MGYLILTHTQIALNSATPNLPRHSYLFVETTIQPTLAVHSADSDVHSDSVAFQTHCSDFCLEGRGISGLFWVQHVGVTLGLERVSPGEEVGHAGPPMPIYNTGIYACHFGTDQQHICFFQYIQKKLT